MELQWTGTARFGIFPSEYPGEYLIFCNLDLPELEDIKDTIQQSRPEKEQRIIERFTAQEVAFFLREDANGVDPPFLRKIYGPQVPEESP